MRERLESERLRLREPLTTDAAALAVYHQANEARIARWHVPRDVTPAGQTAWIAARIAARAAGTAATFLAFTRSGGMLAGIVELDAIGAHPDRNAMLAYSVDRALEGGGYASEAVGAVVAFAFADLRLDRLSATYHPDNVRSAALLERLGFIPAYAAPEIPGLMKAQVTAFLRAPATR